MKNQKYNVTITTDYNKWVLEVVGCIVLLIFIIALVLLILELGWLPENNFNLKIILPIFIVAGALLIFYIVRKSTYKDAITVLKNKLEGEKTGLVDFSTISKYQRLTTIGIPCCLITFKDETKWSIRPSRPLSKASATEFREFIDLFEEELEELG